MYRMWLLFDARRIMIAMGAFLGVLALLIHFMLLSTERFNWLGYKSAPQAATTVVSSVELAG